MKDTTEPLLLPREIDVSPDWDVFYRDTVPQVYNFFLYRIGNQMVAEDLTSATFERAWKHRIRYRADQSKLKTWLFGIARNVVMESFRSQNRLATSDLTDALTDPSISVESASVRSQDRQWLEAVLRNLPAREQELISLKYGAGLTNREISIVTSLTESNVGTILMRTLQKTRKQKEDFDGR